MRKFVQNHSNWFAFILILLVISMSVMFFIISCTVEKFETGFLLFMGYFFLAGSIGGTILYLLD